MTQSLSETTQQLLEMATKAGAEAADVLAVNGTAIAIDVRDGQLEQAERAEGIDIGLRILVGQKQACVSASDTKSETLNQMVERALAMAREAPDDPNAGLASPKQLAKDTATERLQLFDPSGEPDPADLKDRAIATEAAARTNSGITQVDKSTAGYSHRVVHLAATNGFAAQYERSSFGVSCIAIAGTGTQMERDADYDGRVMAAELRDPADIGTTAAARAVARLGARKPTTGTYPVIFDERVANTLVGSLLSAINGGMVARGSSWLKDALGEQILPKGLSLIEEPHRHSVAGSRLFDAEGLQTERRAFVDDGILAGWITDLATARKLDTKSTGNATRGVGGPPTPSVSNIRLTQGDQSREELMQSIGTGLLVTSMIGSTINPNTGDYSRGANGFWIENGEIAYPVNECTIAGNLRDMLGRLIPANDARQHVSRVVPSLLIEGMSVAGN